MLSKNCSVNIKNSCAPKDHDGATFVRCFAEFMGAMIVMIFQFFASKMYFSESYTGDHAIFSGVLTITVVHCFGYISGGFASPNITLACKFIHIMPWSVALKYIACQFLGAICGFYFATKVVPEYIINYPWGLTVPNQNLSHFQIFFIEFIFNTLITLSWVATWHRRESGRLTGSTTIRLGGTAVICAHLGGLMMTGVSTNFATLLTPALFYRDFRNLYIYILAQVLSLCFCVKLYSCFSNRLSGMVFLNFDDN